MDRQLDDATVAYILEQRRHFEDLMQVAGQLAGLLVLAAAGAKDAAADRPILDVAAETLDEAADAVRRARPTASARAHHDHLVSAVAALAAALGEARCPRRVAAAGDRMDSILEPLRVGYAHLQRASMELPGFDLVALEHGCCGLGASRGSRPSSVSRPGSGLLRE